MTQPTDAMSTRTPHLRFPEFSQAGEWEELKLGDYSTLITIRAGSASYIPLSIVTGEGLISQQEKFGRVIAGEQLKNYFVIERNDFAYNKSSTKDYPEGFLTMYTGDLPGCVPNSIFTCFRVDSSELVPIYLNYLFEKNHHGRALQKFVEVGARANGALNINNSDLLSIGIPRPAGSQSLPEQQKIAECLSSLDALIAAHNRKVEALKTYKRGLMQQLFPQAGETVPRLRFPEFADSGEWEEKKLSTISPSIFDGTHQTPKYTEKGIPFYSVENIVSGAKNKYISVEDHALATRINKPKIGDILITRIGVIGVSTVINWEYDFSIYVTLAVISKSELFNSYFLHTSISSPSYKTELLSKSLLTAVPCKINMDELRGTKVLLPSLPEQQKIAECFSALDEMISAQSQRITTLKAHKQGLMQQLFPSPDQL